MAAQAASASANANAAKSIPKRCCRRIIECGPSLRLLGRISSFCLSILARARRNPGLGNDFNGVGFGHFDLRSKTQIEQAADTNPLADQSMKAETRPVKYPDVALQHRDCESTASTRTEEKIEPLRPDVDIGDPAFDDNIGRGFFGKGALVGCCDDSIIGIV